MLFAKNGIKIGVDNPVCYDLFIRQGWKPVECKIELLETKTPIEKEPNEDEVIKVTEETVDDNQEEVKTYKKGHFNTMSVDKIKELAKELGYTITATKKADIVEEFLAQQNK